MVKEYDRGPESQTVLFLNAGHNAGTGKESILKYGIKLAASIARACYGSDSSSGWRHRGWESSSLTGARPWST